MPTHSTTVTIDLPATQNHFIVLLCVGCACAGISIGLLVGHLNASARTARDTVPRKEVVQHGAAHFDADGNFIWNDATTTQPARRSDHQ